MSIAIPVFAGSQNIEGILEHKKDLQIDRFPIGFWNYADLGRHGKYFDEEEVREWAEAGFTVTQTPDFDAKDKKQVAQIRRLLKWASKYDLKLIVKDPRVFNPAPDANEIIRGGVEAYRQSVIAAVKDFSGSKALFGFHLGDEPSGPWNRSYFEAHKIMKEIAPDLHPFMNLLPYYSGALERVGYSSWPEYLDDAVRKADVDYLGYDCYSHMAGGLDNYFENLRLYREAGWRHGVPFWTTVLSVPHYRYQVQGYDDLRWQFNTSICSGAGGVYWFFYYMRHPHDNFRLSPVDENWDRTQLYYDLKRLQTSFHRLYGDIFNHLAVTKVAFYGKAFGGGELFKPDELVTCLSTDDPNHPLLLGEFTDVDHKQYVMLVNNSMTENVYASMTFAGAKTKAFARSWYGGEYEGKACTDGVSPPEAVENGIRFSHWLAPGQEVFYRIEQK